MKNSGMMKPPRHPAETIVDEASNFIPAVTTRVEMARRALTTVWIWPSP